MNNTAALEEKIDFLSKEQLKVKASIGEISDKNQKMRKEINMIIFLSTTLLSIQGLAIIILGIAVSMKW